MLRSAPAIYVLDGLTRSAATATLAMFLLLGGCASTEPARVEGISNPYHRQGRIQWNESSLKHVLSVEAVKADRVDGGLLRVRLVLKNKTRKDVVVDVRTLFTDEDGFEKEQTNWEPIICTARTQKEYNITSLGPDVHDYQVIIRRARDFSWNP